jgi:hypothetical protein
MQPILALVTQLVIEIPEHANNNHAHFNVRHTTKHPLSKLKVEEQNEGELTAYPCNSSGRKRKVAEQSDYRSRSLY